MPPTRNIQQTFIENTLHKHRLEKILPVWVSSNSISKVAGSNVYGKPFLIKIVYVPLLIVN